MRLFSASLDVSGPFARTAEDLALVYDALQGPDPGTPLAPGAAVRAGVQNAPGAGRSAHRRRGRLLPEPRRAQAIEAVESVASALGISRRVEIAQPEPRAERRQ